MGNKHVTINHIYIYQDHYLEDLKIKQEHSAKEFSEDLKLKLNNYEKEFLNKLLSFFKEKIFSQNSVLNNNDILIKISKDFKLISNKIIDLNVIKGWVTLSSNKEVATFLSKEMKYFNILLGGKTGTGKSTLINECLNLLSNLRAAEGFGVPETMETKSYISDTVRVLRLFDFRGIELTQHTIESVQKELERIISIGIAKKELGEVVHAIWYCIRGTRFEPDSEVELLKRLRNIYNDNNLPIIIVYTMDYFDDSEEMKKTLSGYLKSENFTLIPVVARDYLVDGKVIASKKGIPELISITIEKIKNSVESIFYQCIKNELIKLSKEYRKKEADFKVFLEDKVGHLPEKEEYNIDYFPKEMTNYVNYAFQLITNNKNLSLDSNQEVQKVLQTLLKDICNHSMKIYKELIEEFKGKENISLGEMLWNFQLEFNQIQNNTLEIKNKEHWTETATKKVFDLLEKAGENLFLKCILEYYGKIIYEEIIKCVDIIYDTKINEINLDENVKRQVASITEELSQKIMEDINKTHK